MVDIHLINHSDCFDLITLGYSTFKEIQMYLILLLVLFTLYDMFLNSFNITDIIEYNVIINCLQSHILI